jgi:hypothetical protein
MGKSLNFEQNVCTMGQQQRKARKNKGGSGVVLQRILPVKFRHLPEGSMYTCKRHFATIISIDLLLVFLFNAVGISPAGAAALTSKQVGR